jgi:hypothetical protein
MYTKFNYDKASKLNIYIFGAGLQRFLVGRNILSFSLDPSPCSMYWTQPRIAIIAIHLTLTWGKYSVADTRGKIG